MDRAVVHHYPVMGHASHRYKVIAGWGQLDPADHPVKDCHEMVMDASERIYLLTNEVKNNILVYDKAGKLLNSWGSNYPGGHGLTIFSENGEEVLLICDHNRHQVIKTTLDGRELLVIDYPAETGEYLSAEQFKPTETAVTANGDIYVTDGYGLQFVIQYNHYGEYIRYWGGRGDADHQFDCVHGIAVDTRKSDNATLLITSRNHNALKRFSLDGRYMETIALPGSFVCRPVIKGDYLYAAVFRSGTNTNPGSGYITILDSNNKVVSTPGGSEPVYRQNKLDAQFQDFPVFIHPHDVCVDNDENIYVCQWKSGRSYPVKLERV